MARPWNFGWPLGPAEVVLRQAAAEMLDWNGSGMSVMEMSHRGSISCRSATKPKAICASC